MTHQAWSRRLYILALPSIAALFYITAAGHFTYTPDDTYIYLQFARNLIHGNGFSFNPGEATYGITSPLWLLMISLGGAIGADLYIGAKVLDLFFASFSLILCYLVAYEIVRETPVALCASVAFSVNAWMLRWAGTGMESSLSVALLLSVILFCLRNEYFISVFFSALLTLVRPEASLIVLLILVDLYVNSHSRRRALNSAAALVTVYLLVLAPWLIYAFKTFGTVVPNTALAKLGLRLDLMRIYTTTVDVARTVGFTDAVSTAVVLVSGGVLVARYGKTTQVGANNNERFFLFRQSILGIGWIVVLPVFYIVSDANVVSRYLLLVTPLLTIYSCFFLYKVVERSRMHRHAYTAVFGLAALIMTQNQIVYRMYVKPGIDVFEQGMETCIIPIAAWLKDHASPDSRVITGDVGAVGYYSGKRICDAAGLVTPSMLPLIQQGIPPYDIIERKLYRDLCEVDYVLDRSLQPERLKDDHDLHPLLTRPFFGMRLLDTQVHYYTIYQVMKKSRQ